MSQMFNNFLNIFRCCKIAKRTSYLFHFSLPIKNTCCQYLSSKYLIFALFSICCRRFQRSKRISSSLGNWLEGLTTLTNGFNVILSLEIRLRLSTLTGRIVEDIQNKNMKFFSRENINRARFSRNALFLKGAPFHPLFPLNTQSGVDMRFHLLISLTARLKEWIPKDCQHICCIISTSEM